MKVRLFWVISIVFGLAVGGQALAKGGGAWQAVSGEGYRVKMPGAPQWTTENHKSFIGDVVEKTGTVRTATGNYSVSVTEIPGIGKAFGGDLLEKAKDGLLKENGGTELTFEKTTFAGQKAKVLTYQNVGGQPFGKAYFTMYKKLLFVLVATGPSVDAKSFSQFFNSFAIVPES